MARPARRQAAGVMASLLDRLRRSTFVQAARTVQNRAGGQGKRGEAGRDDWPAMEPMRFVASDRMHMPIADIARAEIGAAPAAAEDQVVLVANVMGLAGATPALPPPYSELQLQRRRARDFAFAHFLSIFDHRAMSFFWRIAEKYSWPLMTERAGRGKPDPIRQMLLALAGVGHGVGEGVGKERLDLPDEALVTLVAHLADARRSAASLETVLQVATGLPLRIVEGTPTWMSVPASQQTRIGVGAGQFGRLGDPEDEPGEISAAAMIGASVLDAQQHFTVEIGPLDHGRLHEFCSRPQARRRIAQLCALTAGIEQRGSIRLLIATRDIPELRLGGDESPAMLGWTTWMGRPRRDEGIAADCLVPMDVSEVLRD
ncbi:type VI secretion system baseplate subunit TssG [Novosphingobium sp. KACC 22771]|uniref:type VI secretion system baseplate subunit TssG n=1 Tax=Novosphingobium sp. KACC 22771 TaxID=3025670 RepID=UPI00236647F0|nr:type VI secretion system baseplate subunit TssG [Novosphingobium sp. KACC 22771]WDF74077.1 type VI secretion system baseplate subunit TssG [Novosphingobium sp. KACC 22771]